MVCVSRTSAASGRPLTPTKLGKNLILSSGLSSLETYVRLTPLSLTNNLVGCSHPSDHLSKKSIACIRYYLDDHSMDHRNTRFFVIFYVWTGKTISASSCGLFTDSRCYRCVGWKPENQDLADQEISLSDSSNRILHAARLYRYQKAKVVIACGGAEQYEPEAYAIKELINGMGGTLSLYIDRD